MLLSASGLKLPRGQAIFSAEGIDKGIHISKSAGKCGLSDRGLTGKPVQCRVLSEAFDWEDDANPEIPYADTILYKLHVRGFTAHASSNVSARGTYAGIVEKIPYLKDLGITAVELMPVTEFDEVMMSSSGNGFHDAKSEPTGNFHFLSWL